MDFRAIGRSGALGLVIGAVLVLIGEADATLPERLLTLLLAGTAGLAIGAVTEWLTSLLPARIARTGTYFLISAGIAVTISALVTVALVLLSPEPMGDGGWPVPLVVVAIVSAGNVADFVLHRRAQRRLRAFQSGLEDPPPPG
ncbi:hypothetical protein LWF15_35405 [Kineosporia rhizophila]|uniref:hypothetical protein n=1 Tax=Kineosporia rhizophila TaxID=84633 RepID=UPI001E4C7392|nr:hypothetical protein [Kineosporia rhizophila]MCE0540791.1 hypothetical protein [Kineosporia rhizophila]